ncbi:MAG: hypothetical protein M0P42_16905, partial [Gallionella sp.]|nr:hypothetical protein [Gallionella sp.]
RVFSDLPVMGYRRTTEQHQTTTVGVDGSNAAKSSNSNNNNSNEAKKVVVTVTFTDNGVPEAIMPHIGVIEKALTSEVDLALERIDESTQDEYYNPDEAVLHREEVQNALTNKKVSFFKVMLLLTPAVAGMILAGKRRGTRRCFVVSKSTDGDEEEESSTQSASASQLSSATPQPL